LTFDLITQSNRWTIIT